MRAEFNETIQRYRTSIERIGFKVVSTDYNDNDHLSANDHAWFISNGYDLHLRQITDKGFYVYLLTKRKTMLTVKEMRELSENASKLLVHWNSIHSDVAVCYELWTDLEQGDYRFELYGGIKMRPMFSIIIGADVLKTPDDLYRVVSVEIGKAK